MTHHFITVEKVRFLNFEDENLLNFNIASSDSSDSSYSLHLCVKILVIVSVKFQFIYFLNIYVNIFIVIKLIKINESKILNV